MERIKDKLVEELIQAEQYEQECWKTAFLAPGNREEYYKAIAGYLIYNGRLLLLMVLSIVFLSIFLTYGIRERRYHIFYRTIIKHFWPTTSKRKPRTGMVKALRS